MGFPSIDTTFMAQATGTARQDSLYQQVVGRLDTAENAGPGADSMQLNKALLTEMLV